MLERNYFATELKNSPMVVQYMVSTYLSCFLWLEKSQWFIVTELTWQLTSSLCSYVQQQPN